MTEHEEPEELSWIASHRCTSAVWKQGQYTGVWMLACMDSTQRGVHFVSERGFHIIRWGKPPGGQ